MEGMIESPFAFRTVAHAWAWRVGAIALLALCTFGVACVERVEAQQIGAQMQPTLIEERIDPGETLSGEVTVTNVSDETQTYYLFSRNVESTDIDGKPRFATGDDETGLTLASWVTLTRSQVTLAPGQSDSIGYVISPPANSPPGGHFGAIVLDRQADRVQSSGAGIGFQVASLMNIQINGDIVEDLKITQFSTDRSLYQYPPAIFTTVVENTGSVLQRPVGILTIEDMLGNEVAKLEVNPGGRGGASPGGERRYQTTWEPEEGFFLGRYDARITVSYGVDRKQSITRETSFWVIPTKELGIAFGGLLLFFLIVWGGARLYVRAQLKQAGYRAKGPAPVSFASRLSSVMLVFLSLTILVLVGIFLFFS